MNKHRRSKKSSRVLKVFTEIQQLVMRDYKTVQGFLKRVLLAADKLVGSDVGFIGLIEREGDQEYVVVRDKAENIIGARTGEWNHYLGRHRVGGEMLPKRERSFTGYVAHTQKIRRTGDVRREKFYRPSNEDTRSELAGPILLDGVVLGVINLESRTTNYFTSDHESIVRLVAKLIAYPLHKMMAKQGLRSSIRPLVEEVTMCVDSVPIGLPIDSTAFNYIARAIARGLDSRSCTVWLLNETKDSLVLRGAYGPHRRFRDRHVEKRSDPPSITWQAMDQGACFRSGPNFKRPGRSARFDRVVYGRVLTSPLLIAPLLIRGQAIGVIKVGLRRRTRDNPLRTYSGLDEETLQVVQGQLAAAVQTKQIDLERRFQTTQDSRQLSLLSRILGDVDLNKTLKKAVEEIPQLCGGNSCSIFLWDDDRKEFVLTESNGLPRSLIGRAAYKLGEGFTGWVGKHGRLLNLSSHLPSYVRRIDPGLNWKGKYVERTHRGITAPFLAAPIFGDAKCVGVIRIGDRSEAGPFSQADEQMLTMVANHIWLVIAFRNRFEGRLNLLRNIQVLMARLNGTLSKLDFEPSAFSNSVLHAAGIAASEMIPADVITLYPFHSDRKEFETPPLRIGEIRYPRFMNTRIHRDDLPWKIMKSGSHYWPEAERVSVLHGEVPARDGLPIRKRFASRERILSAAGIRLQTGNKPVGVLFLSFRKRQTFDAETREIIEMLAGQIALVIEIGRLYRGAKESVARETAKFLALELHDAVLQTLTWVVMARADTARSRLQSGDYGRLGSDLKLVQKAAKYCVEESRGIMEALGGRWGLESVGAGPVETFGLLGALRRYRDDVWGPGGLKVKLKGEEPPIPVLVQRHLYRIAQTAIGNVMASAAAKRACIEFKIKRDQLCMTVDDDGEGFDVETTEEGFGLQGIRRRVNGLKGQLRIDSQRDRGTHLKILIPI